MGVPAVSAVFVYIAPWTGGKYTTEDSRITSVIQDVMECFKHSSRSRIANYRNVPSNITWEHNIWQGHPSWWGQNIYRWWWSTGKLAGCYGVTRFNRGQIVKEFLAVRWAKLGLPGGEMAYPMHITIAAQKRALTKHWRGRYTDKEQIYSSIINKSCHWNRDYHTWLTDLLTWSWKQTAWRVLEAGS